MKKNPFFKNPRCRIAPANRGETVFRAEEGFLIRETEMCVSFLRLCACVHTHRFNFSFLFLYYLNNLLVTVSTPAWQEVTKHGKH